MSRYEEVETEKAEDISHVWKSEAPVSHLQALTAEGLLHNSTPVVCKCQNKQYWPKTGSDYNWDILVKV